MCVGGGCVCMYCQHSEFIFSLNVFELRSQAVMLQFKMPEIQREYLIMQETMLWVNNYVGSCSLTKVQDRVYFLCTHTWYFSSTEFLIAELEKFYFHSQY